MKKYLLIKGGGLTNKGAQAMTFITTDEVAKRYPELEVVILSDVDYKRSETEKNQFKFRIEKYPRMRTIMLMRTKFGRLLIDVFGGSSEKRFMELVKNAAAIVDVSGYALGSNWEYTKNFLYLAMLQIAHSVGVPVYLMPQSYGPFDYKGKWAPFINRMLRKNMRYAKVVMCREKEGYDLLQTKYHLNNLILEADLVLQNKGVDIGNIYKEKPVWGELSVPKNSVAVIPNQKTMKHGKPEQLYNLYQRIIEVLQKEGKYVCLVYHSAEDLTICRTIKDKYFKNNQQVTLIERELSCLEFDIYVKNFDFVVASRFHGIVHSYRNAVPAIVLGWATKYQELLNQFEQGNCVFDVRGQIQEDQIIKAVTHMCANYQQNSLQIKNRLTEIQKKNIFDYIKI